MKAQLPFLLVVPFDTPLLEQESCLSGNLLGNYRNGYSLQSVFITDEECISSWAAQTESLSAVFTPAVQGFRQLVWIAEEAIDDSLKVPTSEDQLDLFLERLSSPPQAQDEETFLDSNQDVFIETSKDTGFQLLYRGSSAALLSVPSRVALHLDTVLPRFWKSTPVPSFPIEFIPIPPSSIEPMKSVLANLAYDSSVATIVDSISVPQMRNDIRFLTGEDGQSGIVSRHSFSQGSRVAAAWLKQRFEETGATCRLMSFMQGFAPNVICRYESMVNTTGTVIISGHYDSRGSFGSTRMPGGDDDGSGTTAVLSIARAIARNGVKFRQIVELVAFAGEEQGLYGSRAYANELRSLDANVTLMIQADMLAYRKPGEPMQLGLPKSIGTPEVAQLVANISALYSPELEVGITPACCSDHQSFHEQGYASTQVFERAGPIVDPMYHNSGDLSDREGFDFDQLKAIAKVQFATVLHYAGFELHK
ncbi:Zn-dependent exopeptidase [Lentinula raphanica]|nr:Zn-dependent exopeptidase [Lentinula raphanica]